MPGKGWFNLEAGGSSSVIPDTSFFEGDSAFKFLNLSKTTRLYGFIGWCVPHQRSTSSQTATSDILYRSLIAGFVLSLLGTIVLAFGMLLLFSGTFVVLISGMPLTLRNSAVYPGNHYLSHWNWLSHWGMYNSRYVLELVAKIGMTSFSNNLSS